MLKLITFRISGEFAAFRDPSVTSNQTAYYIPSKSAVIGILGAMIGIRRSDTLDEIYSKEYLEFFKNTKIGLQLECTPKKVVFFTNHRSLKEPKTKPFKTELVENPTYTIYVKTDEINSKKLINALEKHEFVYAPYFGHAYCPTRIENFRQIDVSKIDPKDKKTKCVILDESETYNLDFQFECGIINDGGSVIVERHIHHFFEGEKFDARVLKHWIPTNNSELEIERDSTRSLSEFYTMKDHVICMY